MKKQVSTKPRNKTLKNLPSICNVDVDILADSDEFIPKYETKGAACCDIHVNLKVPPEFNGMKHECQNNLLLPPRRPVKIDCGFSIAIPNDYKINISLRSSWALKGLIILNAPGKIDPDYRGRIALLIANVGNSTLNISHLDRIAQMEIEPIYKINWNIKDKLSDTERGDGGFGSTGN